MEKINIYVGLLYCKMDYKNKFILNKMAACRKKSQQHSGAKAGFYMKSISPQKSTYVTNARIKFARNIYIPTPTISLGK